MNDQIDPKLLEFLMTLPPEVREMLLQRDVTPDSQYFDQDNQQGVFTPGEGGSTVVPRQGPLQEPTLLQALDNQRRKRSKAIVHPNINELMGY